MNTDILGERARNKSTEKIQDPARIRTQDLLNTTTHTHTSANLGYPLNFTTSLAFSVKLHKILNQLEFTATTKSSNIYCACCI